MSDQNITPLKNLGALENLKLKPDNGFKQTDFELDIESQSRPERVGEKLPRPERVGEKLPKPKQEDLNKNGARGIVTATNVDEEHRAREKKIEAALEAGIEDLYLALPPEKQKEFRLVGEETAWRINALLDDAKLTIRKIVDLIKDWLKMIPGIDNFFLEQEAKNKADKIIILKR